MGHRTSGQCTGELFAMRPKQFRPVLHFMTLFTPLRRISADVAMSATVQYIGRHPRDSSRAHYKGRQGDYYIMVQFPHDRMKLPCICCSCLHVDCAS